MIENIIPAINHQRQPPSNQKPTTQNHKLFYIFDALKTVAVAQLVRASDCGSEGRGFETHQPPKPQQTCRGFLLMYYAYVLKSLNDERCYYGHAADRARPFSLLRFCCAAGLIQVKHFTNRCWNRENSSRHSFHSPSCCKIFNHSTWQTQGLTCIVVKPSIKS